MRLYSIVIRFIYHVPLWAVIPGMIFWVFVWSGIMILLSKSLKADIFKRFSWTINGILLLAGLFMIVRMTMINRTQHTDAYELRPLSIFWGVHKPADYWQVMVLNVLLFLPLGTALPYCISLITKWPVLWSIAGIFVLSVIIEMIQLMSGMGVFEVDDILCNTAGGSLGTVSCILYRKVIQKKEYQTGKDE